MPQFSLQQRAYRSLVHDVARAQLRLCLIEELEHLQPEDHQRQSSSGVHVSRHAMTFVHAEDTLNTDFKYV